MDDQIASTEIAEWNRETMKRLAALREELGSANGDGYTDEEILQLRAMEEVPEGKWGHQEIPTTSVVEVGDIWLLGGNRLMCGDSTKAGDVGRLLGKRKPFIMVTDPPYGVDYDPKWRDDTVNLIGIMAVPGKVYMNTMVGTVSGDSRADWSEAYSLFPGDVAYIWHSGVKEAEVALSIIKAGFTIRSQIIWNKQSPIISRGAYHWKHEPLIYAVRSGGSAKWEGGRKQTTIWDIKSFTPMGRSSEKEEKSIHGTQKPIECMARPIRNHGGQGDDVYDPFLGSGTTILAAYQLGRRCFGMELDPVYCDLTLQRWLRATGIEPIRECDKASYSLLAAM